MFIPNFDEIIKDMGKIAKDNRLLKLFPKSFQYGQCMSNLDVYFPRIFSSNNNNVPIASGVVISSIKDENYLGLLVLDYKLDRNFVCPFFASGLLKQIAMDPTRGFATKIRDINEVPGLLNSVSEIDRIKGRSGSFLERSLDVISRAIAGPNLSAEVDSCFAELDSILYDTKYTGQF